MIAKIEELITVLIPLAKEATAWLQRENNPVVTSAVDADVVTASVLTGTPVAGKKSKKADKAPEPAPVVAAEPELTEEESLATAFATAKEVAQRFQKVEPDGLTRLRGLLKTGPIATLTHEQRLEFIGKLKAMLAEGV